MRYLIVLVVGLLAGALLASFALGALQQRHAWPRAVMTTMRHAFAATRPALQAQTCNVAALARSHALLSLLARDIEPAVLGAGEDRAFSRYAADFRATLAQWDPAAPCSSQTEAVQKVDQACDACHRDYHG